jgi:hypothetical protein
MVHWHSSIDSTRFIKRRSPDDISVTVDANPIAELPYRAGPTMVCIRLTNTCSRIRHEGIGRDIPELIYTWRT